MDTMQNTSAAPVTARADIKGTVMIGGQWGDTEILITVEVPRTVWNMIDAPEEWVGTLSATKRVKVGNIINHAAIRRAIQALRDKYAEDGYFLAEARYDVVPQKANQVNIKFTVKEHQKVTVRRVTFIGNHSINYSVSFIFKT